MRGTRATMKKTMATRAKIFPNIRTSVMNELVANTALGTVKSTAANVMDLNTDTLALPVFLDLRDLPRKGNAETVARITVSDRLECHDRTLPCDVPDETRKSIIRNRIASRERKARGMRFNRLIHERKGAKAQRQGPGRQRFFDSFR